jgi:hypothetical protein
MRPGAGYLPTLVLGRPRGLSAEPGAATEPGVRHMTLLRSAPRQVYRVYPEEEFLAAEDWREPVEAARDFAPVGGCEPRPWGRVAAVAALTAVIAAVVGVVAINGARSRAGIDRMSASRRIALGGRVAKPAAIALNASRPTGWDTPRHGHALGTAAPRRAAERNAVLLALVRARRPGFEPRAASAAGADATQTRAPSPAAAPARADTPLRPASTATATTTAATAGPATATAASPPTAAPETAEPATAAATATAASTTTAAARGVGQEFGFER